MTIQDYKQELMLDGACYINCAYMGPVRQRAILARREGINREAAPYKITAEHFFSYLTAIREQLAHSVSATRPDSIALFSAVLRNGNNCKEHRKQSRGVLSEYKTAA
jgi:hypothetical protein